MLCRCHVQLFVTPWTVAPPPSPSVHGEFSRQEYWKGLPCPYIMRLNKFPQLFIDEIQNRIIIKEYSFLQCRSSDEKNGNFFF